MKSILLATASILAFAGAAAADVTFGGDATLGFNIDNGEEGRDDGADENGAGFFWEANLGVTLSQELNNGLTAAATFTLNAVDDDNGDGSDAGAVTVDDNFLLSLTTEQGGLFFGDTAFAAETHWDGVESMDADAFSEQDDETVLRGDFSYAGIEASVSAIVADAEDDRPTNDDGDSTLDQISVGADTKIGQFNLSFAYQEESDALGAIVDDPDTEGVDEGAGIYNPQQDNDDFTPDEIFGISAGTSFGGADITLAFARDTTTEDNSYGFEVAYPFGPVTLGAYYVVEDDAADTVDNTYGVTADYASGPLTVSAFYEHDDGNDDGELEDADAGIEVGYDVGNGLEIYAGLIDDTGNYIGAEYDLGNGAEVILSYAEQDEEGAREYEGGTTLALSLEF